MLDSDRSRIPSINSRVHREVLHAIFQVLENDEGAVSDKDGTVINISFMALLKDLEYDSGDEACTLGATYRQLYKIGHQVGFGKKQMNLWINFCRCLPLSQKMATHLISNLTEREKETKEARRLIGEGLEAKAGIFEAFDNRENPENVTFKGDQITPGMAALLGLLMGLGGKENFIGKDGLVAEMERLHGGSAHSTNGLLHQLKKRGYVEERRVEPASSSDDHKDLAYSCCYRLSAEFRVFLEEHDLHALVRQHLRSPID